MSPNGRALLARTVLPALVVSAGVGAWLLLRLGLPVLPLLAGGGVFYGAVVLALERWLPFAKEWQGSKGDVATDLAHLAITGGLVEAAPALGLSPASLSLWPARPPLFAQLVLVLLATDFLNYWVHRLMHGPLWRFHAVHHSARRLYWMNSWRVHPMEALIYFALSVVPLLLLGAPESALTIVWAFTTVFRLLQHSNVEVRLGPLNWILSGPEPHRWHHSQVLAESEANYGSFLLVWDVLFGTRKLPARPPPLELGLAGGAGYPTTYGAQLAEPFRKQGRST